MAKSSPVSVLKAYWFPLILFASTMFYQLLILPRSYPPSHYDVLGITRYSFMEQVTEAYEKFSSKWHTFHGVALLWYTMVLKFDDGTGEKVRFWLDKWCGSLALAVRFPLIFSIAKDRQATVASYLGTGEVVDGEVRDNVIHKIKVGWLKYRSATDILCDR
ncbi:hypothetical protein HYC85_029900 [Camellia sinensis]|uniref:Uncharacterized protein n=1 Tax=Camellia sinensis TaxID=4442 RepID=A0A7J7FZE3_CAMSI|nr:hypothetical protein HYC85_029900 [Camellia sinensis]